MNPRINPNYVEPDLTFASTHPVVRQASPVLQEATDACLEQIGLAEGGLIQFDPTIIITIFEMVVAFIQQCQNKNAAQLKQTVTQPGLLTKSLARLIAGPVVSRNYGSILTLGARQFNGLCNDLTAAVFAAAAESSIDKLNEVRAAALVYGK